MFGCECRAISFNAVTIHTWLRSTHGSSWTLAHCRSDPVGPSSYADCILDLVFVEYAQVLRMLGNGRLEAMCIDGIKRLCHIRGKMRKKVWVNTVCPPHNTHTHMLHHGGYDYSPTSDPGNNI